MAEDIGPAVFGLVRPAIVVPRWLLDEAVATRDAAMSHENQHIAARDPVLLLVALLLLAVAPWNLPLWWQLRRLKLAIEVDCDTRVLGAGVDRRLYADTLLRINQYVGKMPLGAVAIVGRATQTESRIRAMMTKRPRHLRLWILGLAATSIPLLVVAAELNPPSSAPAAQRVYLGIGLADLDVNAGAASITAARHGAIVTSVNPGSVADQTGLKRGDLIIQFGDTTVISARTLATAVARTAPDARVPLLIQRGSVNQKLMADFSTAPPPQPPSAQIVDTSDWDSLRDANLSISQPQLRGELIRMAKLDELQSLFQKATTGTRLPPDTSANSVGPRMEPGANEANVRRLREIIAQYGWPTVSMVGVRGATAAAWIAVGARNDPAFQAQALGLMEPLLQRDEVPTMYYASLFDALHTPQRFGMIFECVKGVNQPSKPVEDPQHLEERRAALGLPKMAKFCISATGAKGTG
ncbi:MAG TPA: M56 family metallopeptidase [Steroidobacteraceae bacterium]